MNASPVYADGSDLARVSGSHEEYDGVKGRPADEAGVLSICDLHVHTTFSDGALNPREVFLLAAEKGLTAVGITDHDTVGGIAELCRRGVPSEVELVPGIEINTEWKGRELHILGYYIHPGDPSLAKVLADQRRSRVDRIESMVAKLTSMGYPIDLSRIMEFSQGDSPGRPHIAQALMERGYVKSIREAFDRFLGIGKPAYVERKHLSPSQACDLISAAGGVPVWAHPGTARCISILPELMSHGLKGIEAFHPEHDQGTSKKLVEIAKTHDLIVTGGSDFHGFSSSEGSELGSVVVPYAVVEQLKKAARTKE